MGLMYLNRILEIKYFPGTQSTLKKKPVCHSPAFCGEVTNGCNFYYMNMMRIRLYN